MIPTIESFMHRLVQRDPLQVEFHQAVEEVLNSVWSQLEGSESYAVEALLERLVEPERIIQFRVAWVNDMGQVEVNRGFRVQMNSALGPYKGGLRFHPTVNLGILKFLAFEQVFKNALTGLPLGAGKGGADFNPRGRSDGEVMRFCQAFMSELYRHIGNDVDVPAGDIGVGAREIGFLFGMYKKLANQFSGVLTGKGESFGGSLLRPEATGYGLIYFVEQMLLRQERELSGLRIAISGSGNVAQAALEKAKQLGASVVTVSDSGGTLYYPQGLSDEHYQFLLELKNCRRGRLAEMAEQFGLAYFEGQNPWQHPCDIALPCATQNELDEKDVLQLVGNGCFCIAEGANMPVTPKALQLIKQHNLLYAPGKASNAGGVSVSGLEMSQNAQRLYSNESTVDEQLRAIMRKIHQQCVDHGLTKDGDVDYMEGANQAAFAKVAEAMLAQGVV